LAYLLEHLRALANLGNDVLVEDGLSEHLHSAMLALNTQLLGLDVNLEIVNSVDTTFRRSLLLNPISKLVVGGVATAFAFLVILVAVEHQLLLQVAGEGRGLAGLDCFVIGVDLPLVPVGFGSGSAVVLLGFGLELAREVVVFILATGGGSVLVTVLFAGAVGRGVLTAVVTILMAVGAVLLGDLGSPASGLVLLALLVGCGVLEDEAAQFVAEIDVAALAACLAVQDNTRIVVLEDNIGLGVLALLAEHKLADEAIEMILQLGGLMGAVDDPTVVRRVDIGLGTELEAKELDEVGTRPGKALGDTAQVHDNGLDAVALAFDLGLKPLHLVAVEGVGNIPTDIDEGSHGCGWWDEGGQSLE
jgi:hypothetical protein